MEALNFTLLCLPKMKCSQKSRLPKSQPSISSLFANSAIPTSLICPRRLCQRLVLQTSELTAAAIPDKVLPLRTYDFAEFISPIITMREPDDTFRSLFPHLYL